MESNSSESPLPENDKLKMTRLLGLGRGTTVRGKLGGAIRLSGCRRRRTGGIGPRSWERGRATVVRLRRGTAARGKAVTVAHGAAAAARGAATAARRAAAVAHGCGGARLWWRCRSWRGGG
jgi:hypothetical protein